MVEIQHLPIVGAIVEHMDEGLVVYDEDGNVLFTNPMGAKILKSEETVGTSLTTSLKISGKTYTSVLYVLERCL